MTIQGGQTVIHEHSICAPCVACRLPLPILPRSIERGGMRWHCARCDTIHHGVLVAHVPHEVAANVRTAELVPQSSPHRPQGEATKPLPVRDHAPCGLETLSSRELDDAISKGIQLQIVPKDLPLISNVRRHGANPYDALSEERFVAEYEESQLQVERLVESLQSGKSFDLRAPVSITQESLRQVSRDMDLFVKLGINPPGGDCRGKHGLHVAMLAVSIGANMGWDEKTLVELGVGCLVHDLGMIRIPEGVYNHDRVLDAEEFSQIARHPIHTFDLLTEYGPEIPLVSRMVAYQIHERCDGSGYPRNRLGTMIHDAAKVAAVADVYIALISPRRHRPALMPYYAVEHLLYGVKEGQFDSAVVRALLKTISLFPIGSFFQLADKRVGRVIRANPDNYGRPVAEVWSRERLHEKPQVMDLSQHSRVEILGPLASLEGGAGI